jgi:hypothetical protein
MIQHAAGSFEVKVAPLCRMSIDEEFHGDLDATSKGEMPYTPPPHILHEQKTGASIHSKRP